MYSQGGTGGTDASGNGYVTYPISMTTPLTAYTSLFKERVPDVAILGSNTGTTAGLSTFSTAGLSTFSCDNNGYGGPVLFKWIAFGYA